jgi:hypothetical protein
MRVLPSICPNSIGFFVFGSDAYKAMISTIQLALPILNKEKIVHPMVIANKFCDIDQRFTYIKELCSAMTVTFRISVSSDNIEDFNDVIIVMDAMIRISKEHLD